MPKTKQTPLGILTESIGLYFSNFDKFLKYMSFPVLGQIAGLGLVFLFTYFYTKYIPELVEKYTILDNFNVLILISIALALPGLAIFVKAFWEYLVAYGAVNSMLDNMLKSGKVYDFDAHTELIKRRTLSFVGLWFLFGIFSFLALFPPFWIICAVFAVYFVLVFQVFTFEPALSPIGCVKRSLMLIKGHFASTFMLMALIGILTYVFIPQLFIKLFDLCGINNFLSQIILPFINDLPDINLEMYGFKPIAKTDIALFTIQIFAAQIFIQYTLPLRSILWSMWYKELNQDNKRPSEKLMEKSHKKYGSKKKLDKNIIKRASEKNDEF